MDKPALLTVQEIANLYGVTRMAVYNWIKDGLPYKKEKICGIKPYYIIDPDDVDAYHRRKGAR